MKYVKRDLGWTLLNYYVYIDGSNDDEFWSKSLPLKDLSFETVIKRIEGMEANIEETDGDSFLSQDTILKETIIHYYILQNLSQLSKTSTIDPSSIFLTSFLSTIEHVIEDNSHLNPSY